MRPLVLLCATLAALSITAASCDDAPDVRVAQVSRTTVTEVVEAPASVTARAAATLSSPATGTLIALWVKPGDHVEKGQKLAEIESPQAQHRLEQATQALRAARQSSGGGTSVNLGGTQKHLDRSAADAFAQARAAAAQIPDPEHKAAALTQIAAAEASYASVSQTSWQTIRSVEKGLASFGSALRALGAAQVMQAQQAYDLAKSTVDALTLKAPIEGVVQFGGSSGQPAAGDLSSLLGGLTGVPAPTGDQATLPGISTQVGIGTRLSTGTPVLTLVDISELGLVAEVDETDVLLVKEGIHADVELDAAPGMRLEASVTAIDVLPTANSRGAVAYKVHLALSPTPLNPRPGMNALVRLKVRESANTLGVPAAAVLSVDGQDIVWVRGEDGTAVKRVVKVGIAGRELLEITDGLGDGETVVVKGADKVREGDELP